MGIEIRRALPHEVGQSRALRLDMLAESPRSFQERLRDVEVWPPARWRSRLISSLAPDSTMVVAVDEGEWVGQAAGRGYGSYEPPRAYLLALYVVASRRGAGIAEELVHAVEEWALGQGLDALYLDVYEHAAAARALYRRLGYRATGARTPSVHDPSEFDLELVRELGRVSGDVGRGPGADPAARS